MLRQTAPIDGSASGQEGQARVRAGAAVAGNVLLAEVEAAIDDALRMGTISFDAVKHLLLCRIEQRPPRLDLENYPHLPLAQVPTTQAADYMVCFRRHHSACQAR